MKKLVLLLLPGIIAMSCSKENGSSSGHRLKNCYVDYLLFQDDIRMYSQTTFTIPPDEEDHYCNYRYAGDDVYRSVGAFIPVPAGTNLLQHMFSHLAYDSMVTASNVFTCYGKFQDDSGYYHEYEVNPVTFGIGADHRLEWITKPLSLFNSTLVRYSYIYGDTTITEMINDTLLNRTFYFSGNNLVKVIKDIYVNQNHLLARREIVFRDFDNSPNPFKGRFYLRGAFFRAFSENNYRTYIFNEYHPDTSNVLVLTSTSYLTVILPHTADGWPAFGEYE